MIYVSLSATFIDGDINKFDKIIKIGYCKDDNKKHRLGAYITENPSIILLYTIPGGTEQDEKNLHHRFRNYLKYGNEWFSYEQEILDFFTTHTTKESLEELDTYYSKSKLIELKQLKNARFLENKQKYINPILHNLGEVEILEYIKKQEELATVLNNLFLTSSDIDNYFRTNYPDVDFNTPEIISKEAQKILQEFENQQFFNNKMRYLYSLHMDEDIAKQVLNNIYDTSYAKYYWTIPANRAGSLKYQKGELEKEYQAIMHPELIKVEADLEQKNLAKDIILTTFLPDNKYLKSDIKETLKKIYEGIGYSKTPKASDLEEYFEIKECKITNSLGKQDHGFKILKKKE